MQPPRRPANPHPGPARESAAPTIADREIQARALRWTVLHSRRGALVVAASERAIRLLAWGRDTLYRWRQRRMVRQSLMAMDERLLRDIGIARQDIPAIAAGLVRTRADLPSAALDARAGTGAMTPSGGDEPSKVEQDVA